MGTRGEGAKPSAPPSFEQWEARVLDHFAMHGPHGARLHAPRVAPARILAAEMLRPRAELHILSRAHFASAACADDQQTRTLSHGQWKEEER